MTPTFSASWSAAKNPAAPNVWPRRLMILSTLALRSVRSRMSSATTSMSASYGVDPFSPVLYDLTVNSDRTPVEASIEAILAAVRQVD